MQHIRVIAVGRQAGFYAAGVAEYAKRLGGLCRFEICEIAEEPLGEKTLSEARVQAALKKEGNRILDAVQRAATLVALCVEGKQQTSEQFSAWLDDVAGSGKPAVAFAIGSSHGLSDAVKAAAQHRLCLGSMTLPHQLARLVLCEQLYRAMTIRGQTKYHK